MGFYLLSWEIFTLDTTQIYFCDLLNISALFLKQSWKRFLPDLFPASPHPLLMETPGWQPSYFSNQHCQPCVQLLGGSIFGLQRCHSCSFFTEQVGNLPCLNGTTGKTSCSVVIYNMGKRGVLSTKFQSIQTHTLFRYFKQTLKAQVQSFLPRYGKNRKAINCTGRW